MEKICALVGFLPAVILTTNIPAQTPQTPLDRYLENGKTIVIAKCLAVGPVNILLRADVRVGILLVVKGKETLREISVDSQYGMTVGERYLLRTENEATADGSYFRINSVDSVIPIWSGETIETLKSLSPRIVVLRTMNLRVDMLESEIRQRSYELEALKASRREN